MSFALYQRKTFTVDPIPPGHFSIGKGGTLRCHSADLRKARITDKAVVLLDASTSRIALRAPCEEEADIAIAVSSVGKGPGKKSDRRQLNLAGAIRQLKLDPSDTSGRGEFQLKENLLIMNLDAPSKDDPDELEDNEA